MPDVSVVDLVTAIETRLKKVSTQSLDLSFNEILDICNNVGIPGRIPGDGDQRSELMSITIPT